jgi:uncharacterized cupin superfamily protein
MTSLVVRGRVDASDFRPITSEEGGWDPVEGDASARVHDLCQTDEVWSGIALVEPCKFEYHSDHRGMIQLLEGSATVVTDDGTLELGAGDVLYLSPGAKTSWEITSPLREFFYASLTDVASSANGSSVAS